MAKKSLLSIVQDILSDADGDNVNSISDTVESYQCARIVQDCHDLIVDLHDIEHTKTVKQLTATDSDTPAVMLRPEGFHTIEWIKYDMKTVVTDPQNFGYVEYMEPDDFVEMQQRLNTDDTEVETMTLNSGIVLPIRNDRSPKYYTVMDTGSDEFVFDSYDSDLDTNLQASKSMAYGTQRPSLTLSDASTMSLPRHMESLIEREAKAMFFDLFKDGVTREQDRTRRRMEVRAQRQRNIVKNSDNDNRPDYGRK